MFFPQAMWVIRVCVFLLLLSLTQAGPVRRQDPFDPYPGFGKTNLPYPMPFKVKRDLTVERRQGPFDMYYDFEHNLPAPMPGPIGS